MNKEFLKKANSLKPELFKRDVFAEGDYGRLEKGQPRAFDLQNHYVGRLRLRLSAIGTFDGPALLRIRLAENPVEFETERTDYNGNLTCGWLQEEYVHVDGLPCTLRLPRRYACRYIRLEVLSFSPSYRVSVDKLVFREETAANSEVLPIGKTQRERRVDEVALRTLRSCMQDVFEDGPKRDRRLWLGDLYLQAMTNYYTYQNYDLVKRCLYLFAGTVDADGRCKGCVYTGGRVYVNEGLMFDYPMLFAPTLLEYFEATGDRETAEELLPVAIKQAEVLKSAFGESGLLENEAVVGWCHIDWSRQLDKLACGQAVYIYGVKATVRLLEGLKKEVAPWLTAEIDKKSKCAARRYFDRERGLFVDREGRVSYMQNAWYCLAGILSPRENACVLKKLREDKTALLPSSPYGYHYYVEALCGCDEKVEAKRVLMKYWGKMVDLGADTFYEVFDPNDLTVSPYGCVAINSYCHAWSCTPAYFFRKYGL